MQQAADHPGWQKFVSEAPSQCVQHTSHRHLTAMPVCAAFFVLYHAFPSHPTQTETKSGRYLLTQQSQPQSQLLAHAQQVSWTPSVLRSHTQDANSSHHPGRHILTASVSPKAANTRLSNAVSGNPDLPVSARAVRMAFYLWLTLINLLATSTLWARAADSFDSNAAKRLFGFLGAGATMGKPCQHDSPHVHLKSSPALRQLISVVRLLCCAFAQACQHLHLMEK